ncbi:MAG TPA: hypothetical protein VF021_12075 [Longimicrobiales bacterium]
MSPPRHSPEIDAADELPHTSALGQAPGTMILVLIFLAAFVTYYFANWKLLSFLWKLG